MGNVVRSKTSRGEGLVPRWGRGEAWQNPQRQLAVPNHNSSISYLGVPVATGMSDWFENDVTRFRKCFGVPEIFRIVIPAKAGIQKGRGETATQMRNTQTDHHSHPPMWPSGEMCVPSSYRSNLFCQSKPHRHQNSVGLGRAWPAKWS